MKDILIPILAGLTVLFAMLYYAEVTTPQTPVDCHEALESTFSYGWRSGAESVCKRENIAGPYESTEWREAMRRDSIYFHQTIVNIKRAAN